MTIQNILEQLYHIDGEADALLRATGFPLAEELGEEVRHLPDPDEDAFMRESIEEILLALDRIHSTLSYLNISPQDEHILETRPGGRFGYCDGSRIREFTSGDCLEAKFYDKNGTPRWVASSIEHDGTDYYLVESHDVPLEGLTVRERR